MNLPVLNFPDYPFRLRRPDHPEIFDPVRRLWVRLTPEEWVRQHCVAWLIHHLKVPHSLISVEKKLRVGTFERRYDILVFNVRHVPRLLIECKAPGIGLNDQVLEQACLYNLRLGVEFLMLSNGLRHVMIQVKEGNSGIVFLEQFPPDLFL